MIYAYNCGKCAHSFDVIKSATIYDRAERCEKCGEIAIREFMPRVTHLTGTQVQHAEYNPGLGCIVNNANHRKEICKQKGVEEIGSEPAEKIHKHFDKKREEKREEAWASLDKQWIGADGDG